MIIFFFFLCAHNIGLFKYPSGNWQAFGDFSNIGFFIVSLFFYLKERRSLAKTHFRQLELLWLLFLVYFIISALSSASTSKYGAIGNIRLAYPYFLFFGTIATLTTQKKINQFIRVIMYFGIIGGAVSIWQSLNGITPLFDPNSFYYIGHWGGQQTYIAPGIARVMLPPLYLIYIIFISLFLFGIVYKDQKYYPLMIFLLIPIFIGFARSQWLAIVLTIAIVFVLLSKYRTIKTGRLLLNVFLFIVAIILSLWIFDKIFGGNIMTQVVERVSLFFYDINYNKGTYGNRLSTIQLSINIWLSNPLWGHGVAYWYFIKRSPLNDVGYTYVLVTIGLVGLVLLIALFVSILIFSYKSIKLAKHASDPYLFLSGMVTLSIPIFLFIAQQYTQSTFTNVLLSLGSGYCAAQYNVFLQKQKYQNTTIILDNR
jgi:O-antigen ligase